MKTMLVSEEPGAMKTVLVVDDDAATREMLMEVLALLPSCVVAAAQDGAEALDLLNAQPADLVVLDVQMPGLSGPEVCRWLHARDDSAHVPVLFLSAGAHIEGGGLAGPWRWMAKPFDIDELLEVAGELLGLSAEPTDAAEEPTDAAHDLTDAAQPAVPAHTAS